MTHIVKLGAETLTNIAAFHGVILIVIQDAYDGIKMDASARQIQEHVTQMHGRTATMLNNLATQI